MKNLSKTPVLWSFVLTSMIFSCKKSENAVPDNAAIKTSNKITAAVTPVGTVIYTSNGYKLTFTNKDANFDDQERQNFVNTFFTVYPLMVNRFNISATKNVTFVVDPAYNGVAATSNDITTFSPAWFKSNPADYDVVTHEVMHIVQAYPGGVPGWLTEGLADYSRYKYGVNNANAGWSLPAWSSSQNYTDSYRVTARFFAWLELHVNSSILNNLNTICHNGGYTSNTWVQLTGKTVDQLWAQYSSNPAL
ncbi:Peptidase [Mucilaginibacter lappiensis]|uniref:Peptidase n=1 Tax=Mucilaginibacter lappiensis TaxID=354630 RepID=A0ABR6PLT7_9SPHI|nr:basic secretory protein-like protein [Mucilaginibacter lappiensis]MBB6110739.1 hypothetical protein [Mucilaginibacter lappiensis]SIR46985.1 Peptidase [Mucilaginibacter lappiensis]